MARTVYITENTLSVSPECAEDLFLYDHTRRFWPAPERVTRDEQGRIVLNLGKWIGDEHSDIFEGSHPNEFVTAILLNHKAQGRVVFKEGGYSAYDADHSTLYEFDGQGGLSRTEYMRAGREEVWQPVCVERYSNPSFDEKTGSWTRDYTPVMADTALRRQIEKQSLALRWAHPQAHDGHSVHYIGPEHEKPAFENA
jgi:hypothetical protein